MCAASAPPAKHKTEETKHSPPTAEHSQQASAKPAWLLALEIVTGIMVGSLFLVAILTTFHRCKNKSSIIIPWKKSASDKDHMAFYAGEDVILLMKKKNS